jgi:hypothetical protein
VVAALVAAVGGAGGYAAATANVPNMDAARAGGTSEGQLIAARGSARLGYERGRREGKRAGFRSVYGDAYEAAYDRRMEDLQSAADRHAAAQAAAAQAQAAAGRRSRNVGD